MNFDQFYQEYGLLSLSLSLRMMSSNYETLATDLVSQLFPSVHLDKISFEVGNRKRLLPSFLVCVSVFCFSIYIYTYICMWFLLSTRDPPKIYIYIGEEINGSFESVMNYYEVWFNSEKYIYIYNGGSTIIPLYIYIAFALIYIIYCCQNLSIRICMWSISICFFSFFSNNIYNVHMYSLRLFLIPK